jgi:2-alkenal reductase
MQKKIVRIIFLVISGLLLVTSCIVDWDDEAMFTEQQIEEDEISTTQLEEYLSSLDYVESEDTLVNIYQRVNPGVVSIIVYTEDGGFGQGSGFVYDNEGYIITNYHVVESASDIEVTFPSGLRTRAEVVGNDPDSDLAVIQVNVEERFLTPLDLGNSSNVQVGQFVVAIGNPFGYSGTMTTGIVSARGRILDSLRSTQSGSFFAAGDLIQTDAAINPGNSGGPLLNLNGQVIGINRAIYADSNSAIFSSPTNSGIGFAIPIDIVKQVVPALIENGMYDYPYLGVSSNDELTLSQLEALGIDSEVPGVYVLEATSGGPAENAGIRGGNRTTEYEGLLSGGDLIIKLDGVRVRNFNDLLNYMITNKAPGDSVIVTVIRNGQERDFEVELGFRPE